MLIYQIFCKTSNELQSTSPITFEDEPEDHNIFAIRRSPKELLPKTCSRTVTKSKLVKNVLRKGYVWLTILYMIH